MTLALRALPVFQQTFIRSDATVRWPYLAFDQRTPRPSKDFWYIPRVIKVEPLPAIDLTCDNRIVVLHAAARSAEYLIEREYVLEHEMLKRLPRYARIYRHRYVDGDYRIGFKFTEQYKKLEDDMKFGVMLDTLDAMADAAHAFTSWIILRRSQGMEVASLDQDEAA